MRSTSRYIPPPHKGTHIKKFIFLCFVCISPGLVSFAEDKLTYESDIFTFEVEQEAILITQPVKAKPVSPTPSKPRSSLSLREKQELKGTKFFEAPSDIKVIIEKVANKHGIDPILMQAISFCESDYIAHAKNENKNGSLDIGVAAINDFHIPEMKKLGLDRRDVVDSYEFMAILLDRNGTGYTKSDYRHSKPCWDVAYKVAKQ